MRIETRDIRRPSMFLMLFRLHWPTVILMLSLACAGVFFIHSATYMTDMEELKGAAQQQIVWIGLGLILFTALALIDYRLLVQHGLWILGGACLLLILTLIIGKEVNGAKSWIRVGGIGLQPAELSKLAYICGLSCLLSALHEHRKSFWIILAAAGLFLVPFVLIMAQPDLGSAMVFVPITFLSLYAVGVRLRYLAIPVVAGVAGFAFAYFGIHRSQWDGTVQDIPRSMVAAVQAASPEFARPWFGSLTERKAVDPERPPKVLLKTYQLNRIRTFFDPDLDPRGAGWTIRQSLIAVGSGGVQGKGYLRGDQNIYGFLPKNIAYNDFIFSVIGEEFGFVGGVAVIAGQALLILCIILVGLRAGDLAGALICTGLAGMFLTHFFINIGMTIQVVPITGIPLPFLSYGGTFVLVCMGGLGLLQSVWLHRNRRSY